jgi:hypothetical protein
MSNDSLHLIQLYETNNESNLMRIMQKLLSFILYHTILILRLILLLRLKLILSSKLKEAWRKNSLCFSVDFDYLFKNTLILHLNNFYALIFNPQFE